ncbi:MAG: hypothetical protein P1V20_15975 [Verrucomicrobiales bacterium]|nr:hypothetical protein [Verrucomicrobiales bacterium]
MRKALYFDSPDDFCDFVRLQGAGARPLRGPLFEFHRIVHPTQPGNSALILFNFKTSPEDRFSGAASQVKAELRKETILWQGDREASPVIETNFAKTLVEFVELHPWSAKRAASAGQGAVLFWLDDNDLVANLISDSLQLGNDRIQFGSLESPSGDNATIVRIENPSFFLIQKCLEEHKDEIRVYYPETGDLFVCWGFEHPLREWWRRSERKRSEEWIFFRESTEFHHVAPVIWRDAYDLTDLQLDFNHRVSWSESPQTPPRFKVPLRLASKAADHAEPELWLLDEPGIIQLENTLQLTDDDSLRSWQLAVQKLNDHPRDWLFIREIRSRAKHSRHHDFGGTGFCRYKGINDLLLPVGYEIQPPLRRDAYRELFQLKSGFLTILIPESIVDEASPVDSFLILKINERSFDALSSFVDYIIQRDSAELEDLMNQSVFDFKHYLKAPKHPGLTAGETSADGNRKKPVAGLGKLEPTELPDQEDSEKSESTSLLDRLSLPESELDESLLGELEKEELQLERQLAGHGQSINLWCDLLVCKNRLGKTTDAVICAIEGLWMAKGTSREAGLFDSLKSLAENSLEENEDPKYITPQDNEWARRAAVFGVTLREPDPSGTDQWISEASAFLREHDSGLRAKERWLAWGQILSKNLDERRETRLREEIRNQITGQGISLEETPSFLRSRIFLDRKIGGDDANQAAVETAIGNLEALREITKEFHSDRLKLASRTILARAYSQIGDIGRALELLSEESKSTDPCALAWETMFRIEALRKIDQSRAAATEATLKTVLGKVDKDTAKAINELRKTYAERADDDSPAAFLARENRNRTYPGGPGKEDGELYQWSKQLEEHIHAGNEMGAVSVMRAMMTLEEIEQYDDNVKLPQFVETLSAGLERFKWGERGAALIPLYDEFSDRAPGFLSATNNQFYGSILHSNLAHGLLITDNLEKAFAQIEQSDKLARYQGLIDLDFIDAAAALIRTVEQLPLSHRRVILTNLMKNFRERFDRENSPYLSNERLFTAVARGLDQMAEAASSKDRLSLQQFRAYQLQDEFLILQRIQSETFIEQERPDYL